VRRLAHLGCGGCGPQGFDAQQFTAAQRHRANMRRQAIAALGRYDGLMRGLGQDATDNFPAGSQATLGIQSTQTTTQNANAVVANVTGQLAKLGIQVSSVSIQTNPSLLSQTINILAPLLQPFTVQMTVTANSDYAQATDVLAIVNHAFYVATGQMPTASQVVSTAAPGSPQPALTSTTGSGAAPGSVTDWLSANWIWLAAGGVGLFVLRDLL
jgi:hypothetical protein